LFTDIEVNGAKDALPLLAFTPYLTSIEQIATASAVALRADFYSRACVCI
jgi:hypothetical protein